MQGRVKKKHVPTSKLGTTFKNFDFIFCDFIKHPIASIIKENINNPTRITKITLKPTKKMEDTIFVKLFIQSSSIESTPVSIFIDN